MNNFGHTSEIYTNIIAVIEQIRQQIDVNSDLVWTHYQHVDELIAEININIEYLHHQDKRGAGYFYMAFLPTGTFQELAMSNDWSDTYMDLANRFDELYAQLT